MFLYALDPISSCLLKDMASIVYFFSLKLLISPQLLENCHHHIITLVLCINHVSGFCKLDALISTLHAYGRHALF